MDHGDNKEPKKGISWLGLLELKSFRQKAEVIMPYIIHKRGYIWHFASCLPGSM